MGRRLVIPVFGDSGTIVGFVIVGAKVLKPLSRICGVILLLLSGVTANAASGGQGDGRALALPGSAPHWKISLTKKCNRETLFSQLPCLSTGGVLPFNHSKENPNGNLAFHLVEERPQCTQLKPGCKQGTEERRVERWAGGEHERGDGEQEADLKKNRKPPRSEMSGHTSTQTVVHVQERQGWSVRVNMGRAALKCSQIYMEV